MGRSNLILGQLRSVTLSGDKVALTPFIIAGNAHSLGTTAANMHYAVHRG